MPVTLDMAGHGWIWLDMAGPGCVWLCLHVFACVFMRPEVAGDGWRWLGLTGKRKEHTKWEKDAVAGRTNTAAMD
jgi:hypothetical protein